MDRDQLRFNVLRNALYHTSRRLTLDRWNRWFNFLVIILGAQAVASFMMIFNTNVSQGIWGALVAAIGAGQLVFDFGGKARDHQTLQREYYHLLAAIEENPDPSSKELARWLGQMMRISGDEPPTLRALDAKAFNDALGATDTYPQEERLFIPWWHRIFGQFWSYEGYDYKKLWELPLDHRARRVAQINTI